MNKEKAYLEESTNQEVLDWFRMSPGLRFIESMKLWDVFTLLGGEYDPQPDTQSPFHVPKT
jgi:hypothetical protein